MLDASRTHPARVGAFMVMPFVVVAFDEHALRSVHLVPSSGVPERCLQRDLTLDTLSTRFQPNLAESQ